MHSHDLWYARLILVCVAFLHTRHFVSFQACAVILTCLNMMLITLGLVHTSRPLPRTLTTVFERLDIADKFEIRPTCGNCHILFPRQLTIRFLLSNMCETIVQIRVSQCLPKALGENSETFS